MNGRRLVEDIEAVRANRRSRISDFVAHLLPSTRVPGVTAVVPPRHMTDACVRKGLARIIASGCRFTNNAFAIASGETQMHSLRRMVCRELNCDTVPNLNVYNVTTLCDRAVISDQAVWVADCLCVDRVAWKFFANCVCAVVLLPRNWERTKSWVEFVGSDEISLFIHDLVA